MEQTEMARIYVASLADYNAGNLHGKWFELDGYHGDVETLYSDVKRMLAAGPCALAGENSEEWAIHDCDEFQGLNIGEYDSLEYVLKLSETLDELGNDSEAFAVFMSEVAYTSEYGDDMDKAVEDFRDSFRGRQKLREYAEELFDECYGEDIAKLPESIRCYFDMNAFARDLEGDYTEAGGYLFEAI
jgi:antirestriction protein